jgi:molybdopterin synthase catalytic subunit
MASLHNVSAGAFVTFEGRVRAENDGRAVKALDYEAYVPLAEKEGGKIVKEARKRFQITGALCVHRTGSMSPGDIAVWIGIAAGHRSSAFEACRFLIDEMKARLPVWKKEHYAGGATEWINCATRGPGARKRLK